MVLEGLRVHLGCGKRFLDGWIHIDYADLPHIDYPRHDIRELPMFKDETVDEIYACKVLEYFDRIEVVDVLKEWNRTLKIGGLLRLSVPDFGALCEIYQTTGNLSLVHGPLYGIINISGHMIQHKTVYDFASLSTLLLSAGFHCIRRWNPDNELPPGYDDLSRSYVPHMDPDGILTALNIKANKSSWIF